jgi:hypothetical protein
MFLFGRESTMWRIAQILFCKKEKKRNKKQSVSNKNLSETDIVKMLQFFLLTTNLLCLVETIDITMSTNCAPLLNDLFLHSSVAEYKRKEASPVI